MTRQGFIVRLIAALGVPWAVRGQEPTKVTGILPVGSPHDTGASTLGKQEVICESPGGNVIIRCHAKDLQPGEERCPLGHIGKPRYIVLDGRLADVPVQEVTHHPAIPPASPICGGEGMIPKPYLGIPAYDTYKTNLHVCPTCGIVWVPPSTTTVK